VERQASRLGATWYKAQERFQKHGGWAVLLTRFLMNSLDVPVNLVAGSSGYSAQRFLTYVIPGRVLWLLVYLGLGYAFGSQWPLVSQALAAYGGYMAAAIGVLAGGYIVARRLCGRGTGSEAARA
jgi:membrane-associated protein